MVRRLLIREGKPDQHPFAETPAKEVIPAGSMSSDSCRVKPIGTVIAGNPVCGESTWLLSPAGLFISPTLRGELLHVG